MNLKWEPASYVSLANGQIADVNDPRHRYYVKRAGPRQRRFVAFVDGVKIGESYTTMAQAKVACETHYRGGASDYRLCDEAIRRIHKRFPNI